MTCHIAIEPLLSRVRDWWSRHNKLSRLDSKELERVAGELGMSTGSLEDLVRLAPTRQPTCMSALPRWACRKLT